MKIVINKCYGGFGLSDRALAGYCAITGKDPEDTYDCDIERNDPALIQIIESLGIDASGARGSVLAIVEIPDDVQWHISDYDGIEHVAENHRTWH